MTGQRLWHLTLNTGHVAATSRDEVTQPVIDRLLPLIDTEGGPVPGMPGMSVDIHRPIDEPRGVARRGAAFFQIDPPEATQGSKTPMIMAVACWREDIAEEAWGMLRLVAGAHPTLVAPGVLDAAPSLPWLAVLVLPWITAVDRRDQEALGDLERCLFWALVESE